MTVEIDRRGPASSSARPVVRIPRPAPGMRLARARRRAGPRMVLALFERDCPAASLQRAVALARSLDAPLHVLRVLPQPTRLRALFARHSVGAAVAMVQRTLSATQATRAWLQDSPGTDDIVEQVAVVHGSFIEQTAVYTATIGAKLIIVPPGAGRMGKTVTSLARAALVPVFVAREPTGAPAIIAATDLQSADYPVLSRAAEFGRRLHKSLVAVHNVNPQPLTSSNMIWAINLPVPDHALGLRSEQLAKVAERLPVKTSAVVLHEFCSADAIVGEAQARDADLVVIGTRHRNWLDGLCSVSVATQVVNRAQRSVLVLPLEEEASIPVASTRAGRSKAPASLVPAG